MNEIRIRNFGPIRSGFKENDGWLSIHKVTVFTGNQGTGKSTVAKLISTFAWLEKALHSGQLKESEVTRKHRFENTYCGYHRLENYFRPDTLIEFAGKLCLFLYSQGRLRIWRPRRFPLFYHTPRIMYVPAERSFLSAVNRPKKLKGLPLPLYDFLKAYDRSRKELPGNLTLPVGNLELQHRPSGQAPDIVGDGYRVQLPEASSGLQSAVPLYLVSKNLAMSTFREAIMLKATAKEEKKVRSTLEKAISEEELPEDLKAAILKVAASMYRHTCFINIVEEMELNLFPQSQKDLLFKLLEFANFSEASTLIMTTHTPFIHYLTLALKGHALLEKMSSKPYSRALKDRLVARLEAVVPIGSCISSEDTVIYELFEDGSIHRLPEYDGLPSDENILNTLLADTNLLFDALLEIEDAL